ncbi:MBL fold metallo-hydrolase [Actinoplanes philippinensis]|uniref:Glyoxylase, beta-lactamase superfamily II n=1 Tax=Actinoplanes philippinensis TaxID=35752 RepID=A0A1I2N4M8_9ACTN|nr:MBL fold metallo-hydrolase [Actinoplanes philippinensis]GIE76312.1 MBL fold metallo-hydrolase [Actinoplanes philippinensis]SFF98378.1 Glyoxylase, beta-lactamase superfamily II [Actinoplanes philippinensis]
MNEIALGDVTVIRVEETHGPIMPAGAFFPTMPAEAWQEHRETLAPDHLGGDDMVHVAMQSWVLRSDGRTIVIDTGVGNDKNRPAVEAWHRQQSGYLDRLAAAGVRPEDVDLVINTHLHVDHVGWNTRLVDGAWVPTFPNATYLMPEADFHHWNPATNTAIAGGVNEHVYEDSVAPVHQAGQVKLWSGEHVVDAGLTLRAAPGHTPGSSVVVLRSGGEQALFAGDLMHTPLQVMHPGHDSCFCEDPAQAQATRRRLLGWAADNRALVLPAHFSGHSALEVERRGDVFGITRWAGFPRY